MKKLLFTKYRSKLLCLLFHENRLMAVTAYDLAAGEESHIDGIYIGKVKKIATSINACFVEIAKKEVCFLPLSKCNTAFLTNRIYDGRILEGDEIVIQIIREPNKTKQSEATTRISISGHLLVLTVGDKKANSSTRLSPDRKKQLLAYLRNSGIIDEKSMLTKEQELNGIPPFGLVIRTQANELCKQQEDITSGMSVLLEEYNNLRQKLSDIYRKANYLSCFSCLLDAPKLYQAAMKQFGQDEYSEIVTDIPELYEELTSYIKNAFLNSPPEVRLYQDQDYPLSKLYSVETKIKEALSPHVWLKSGGYLVIEPTEALTVIDVNTGKIEEKHSMEEVRSKNHKNLIHERDTFFRTNMEAAEEIARQLRLRNLSGIIIIDFINMKSAKQKEALLQHMDHLVRQDRVKTVVVGITPLGLVEVTRKRLNKSLKEQMEEKHAIEMDEEHSMDEKHSMEEKPFIEEEYSYEVR